MIERKISIHVKKTNRIWYQSIQLFYRSILFILMIMNPFDLIWWVWENENKSYQILLITISFDLQALAQSGCQNSVPEGIVYCLTMFQPLPEFMWALLTLRSPCKGCHLLSVKHSQMAIFLYKGMYSPPLSLVPCKSRSYFFLSTMRHSQFSPNKAITQVGTSFCPRNCALHHCRWGFFIGAMRRKLTKGKAPRGT